jgi:putative ABC transport system permease protein
MENLFVTQSPRFDYLLDTNNRIASVEPGQIMVPLYTKDAYGLKTGDVITIKDGVSETRFTVSGFIRDSQMNASLVSSKRFLINEEDYSRLKDNTGEVEYIIEFILTDLSKTGVFDIDYIAAGLPSGVAITFPMIQLMNAMTGGLSAVVLILASILLIVTAVICLRFTIMSTLEEEYREIGVMKAIGLAPKRIGKLYKTKYYLLSAVSCVIGFILSFPLSSLFTESVSLYMGETAATVWKFVLPMLGALAVFAIIAGFCSLVLRKLRKVSVVEAIRGTGVTGKQGGNIFPVHKRKIRDINIALGMRDVINRFRNYKTPVFVYILCTFLIIVPVNFLNTLNSPEFIGYTGIGYCDAIITLNYSENIWERYATVLETLSADNDITAYAGRITAGYKILNSEGNLESQVIKPQEGSSSGELLNKKYENINIQNGDFTVFPVPYTQGAAPVTETKIALSLLNAREYGKSVGDNIEILVNGEIRSLSITGIYQDLTNGGKSAQAHLPYSPDNTLWYAVSVDFTETADITQKIDSYKELFAPAKVTGIEGYITQTFASTLQQFETVTLAVSAASIAVAILITALFLKLIFVKDRNQITIMKGLGFTSTHIRKQYISATVLSLITGAIIGTIAANTLGELLTGAIMGNMGASKISFVINPLTSYIICPALLLTAVLITTIVSAQTIRRCGNYVIAE